MRVEERVAGIWGARGCGTPSDRGTDSGEPGFVGLTERRGGDEPELGWNRAGAGLELVELAELAELGWSLAHPKRRAGAASAQWSAAALEKAGPGGVARRRSAPRPAIRPLPRRPGGGRGEGGGRAGAQRHSLGPQPGRAGKDTGSLEWPRTEPQSRGCSRQKPGRKGKGERGEGSKLKDTRSSSKTHATNDTLKSLGPKSSGLPGEYRATKPSLLGLFFLGVSETR